MFSMIRKKLALGKPTAALCALFLLAGPALPAHGAQGGLRVEDIVVVEKNGELLVFGSLRGAFSQKLLEAIHSGVPARFVFDVSLLRSRKLIHDAAVFSRQLHYQITYSALKKTYAFLLSEGAKSIEKKATKSRDEMIDWMRELNGAPIASGKALAPSERYYVGIRARLSPVELVFPFNYLLDFLTEKSDWSYSPSFGVKGM